MHGILELSLQLLHSFRPANFGAYWKYFAVTFSMADSDKVVLLGLKFQFMVNRM